MKSIIFNLIASGLLISFWAYTSEAQTFTKVTDEQNPIVTTTIGSNYSGVAWVDYDNDGDVDLFTTQSFLFKNNLNGNFEFIETRIGLDQAGLGTGTSWADYDNDGDLDCFIAGVPSVLYRNEGQDNFRPDTSGAFNPNIDNRGWTGAWGDYNDDGYVDLVITHPAGFVGPSPTPSHFLVNQGNGRFTKDFNFQFTKVLAPYTVASWYDYDLDGDSDLFIASGPAGTSARDYLYENTLIESGEALLERINTNPFGTDSQDGQVWNWIDYDNDRDLDAYVTNYSGASNNFYRNDGGTYVSVENSLTFAGSNLANAWGDIDNDGDLDVVITSESQNYLFRNDGEGIFTGLSNDVTTSGSTRGASFGDYDQDGLLDLFISGRESGSGLFHNDTDNGNNWIILNFTGTVSNKAAIGTIVRAKAPISEIPVWQIREISAQNSFNSHNSLRVHFGMGDATTIDSLIINWPSGEEQTVTNLQTNGFYQFIEPIPSGYIRAHFTTDQREGFGRPYEVQFRDISVVDPNNPLISWQWDFDNDGEIDSEEPEPVWTYDTLGNYSVKLTISNGIESKNQLIEKFISIQRKPGFPILTLIEPDVTDSTITNQPDRRTIDFVISSIDTSDYPLSYIWRKNGIPVDWDSLYNYRSSAFDPVPRTDTIIVDVSNGFNTTTRQWYIHVEEISSLGTENSSIPKTFFMKQNYPNPFNPTTTIAYGLPEVSDVTIDIFDILGRKIRNLTLGRQKAGYYNYTWDAKNNQGFTIPSGVYIYKLTANRFIDTKKMIFIK
jgi:PKD repeat protein